VARFSSLFNNLTGGEISPRYHGRTDLGPLYQNGVQRLENFLPNASGGVSKRQGTAYVGDVTGDFSAGTTSTSKIRAFPFVSGTATEVFAIETTPLTVGAISCPAVPADDAVLFDSGYSTAATVTAPAHRDATTVGLYKTVFDAMEDPCNSNEERNFMGIADTYYFGTTELDDIYNAQYVQVGEVLVIVQKYHAPIFLKRTGDNTYTEYSFREFAAVPSTFDDVTENWAAQWILGTPYRDLVVDKTTQPQMSLSGGTAVGVTNTITITNEDSWGGFTQGHIGSVFISTISAQTGAIVITDVTDVNTATGVVLRTFGGTGATSDWKEPAWSNTRGWPRSVTYFQGRLLYGGNEAEPTKVWGSQAFDIGQMTGLAEFDDISYTAVSSDPFASSIASSSATVIQWMENNDNNIFIGSSSREYIATIEAAATVSTLSVRPQTTYGSSHVQAKSVNNAILFVARDGVTVRELSFNFNDDNFVAEDISAFADHLAIEAGINKDVFFQTPKILHIELQRTPENTLWCLTNNNGLYGVTRDRQLRTAAWHRVSFPGAGPTIDITNGTNLEEVCDFCIREGVLDLFVDRVIDGAAVKYHESLKSGEFTQQAVYSTSAYNNLSVLPQYLDSYAISFPVSATISGLLHLEGQTVRCLAASATNTGSFKDYGTFVVDASGEILLPEIVNSAVVGLDFDAVMATLPIEAGSQLGNAQGAPKRIERIEEIVFRLYRSAWISIAQAEYRVEDFSSSSSYLEANASVYTVQETTDFQRLNFVPTNIPNNHQIPLFTGDVHVRVDAGYDTRGQMLIKCDQPYPCIIAALIFKGMTNDR
jgi:hypothetical protein